MPRIYKRKTGDLSGTPSSQDRPDQHSQELKSRLRAPLRKKDTPIWKDLRILLAVKLYAGERLSSERASRLAGVNHVEFLLSLSFYKVFPFQSELNELEAEGG